MGFELSAVTERIPRSYRRRLFEACNEHAMVFIVINLFLYGSLTKPLFGGLFIGGVLIHEAGHYVAQRYYGYNPKLYVFPLLGAGVGEPYNDDENEDLHTAGRRDIFLAGPAASLSVSAISSVVFLATGMYALLTFAIVLAFNDLFNLLPFSDMDGGRTDDVRQTLWKQEDRVESALTGMAHTLLVAGNVAIIAALLLTQRVSLHDVMRGLVS